MKLWNKLRYLLNREAFDRDLQEELRIHREMAEEKLNQLGTAKEEALRGEESVRQRGLGARSQAVTNRPFSLIRPRRP